MRTETRRHSHQDILQLNLTISLAYFTKTEPGLKWYESLMTLCGGSVSTEINMRGNGVTFCFHFRLQSRCQRFSPVEQSVGDRVERRSDHTR